MEDNGDILRLQDGGEQLAMFGGHTLKPYPKTSECKMRNRVPNFQVVKDDHLFCKKCSALGGVDQESCCVFASV